MTRTQANALLALMADLYLIASAADPEPEPAPAATNGAAPEPKRDKSAVQN